MQILDTWQVKAAGPGPARPGRIILADLGPSQSHRFATAFQEQDDLGELSSLWWNTRYFDDLTLASQDFRNRCTKAVAANDAIAEVPTPGDRPKSPAQDACLSLAQGFAAGEYFRLLCQTAAEIKPDTMPVADAVIRAAQLIDLAAEETLTRFPGYFTDPDGAQADGRS